MQPSLAHQANLKTFQASLPRGSRQKDHHEADHLEAFIQPDPHRLSAKPVLAFGALSSNSKLLAKPLTSKPAGTSAQKRFGHLLTRLLTLVPAFIGSSPAMAPLALQAQSPVVQTASTDRLTQSKAYLNQLESDLAAVEKLAPSSSQSQSAQQQFANSWNDIRGKAVRGDVSAHDAVQAYWLNRFYLEMTNPHAGMYSLSDDGFWDPVNQVRNGQITQEQFKEIEQHRGMWGLGEFSIRNEKIAQNPLIKPADFSRFFEPLLKICQETQNTRLKARAHNALSFLMGKLTPEQITKLAQHYETHFKTAATESDLFLAMDSLHSVHGYCPKSDIWKTMSHTLAAELKTLSQQNLSEKERVSGNALKEVDKASFKIVLLGMIQSKDLAELSPLFLTPEGPAKSQQAMAWALGMVAASDAINDTLIVAIQNDKLDPFARELAVSSMAYQYSTSTDMSKGKIKSLLNEIYPQANLWSLENLPKENQYPKAIQQMARGAQIFYFEPWKTQADFFVTTWIKDPVKQKDYARLRNQYIVGWEDLTTQQKNMVDRALIPYQKYLPDLISKKAKHTFAKGGITELPNQKEMIGNRFKDGRLYEMFGGLSTSTGTVTQPQQMTTQQNTFAHEFTHDLHTVLKNENASVDTNIAVMFERAKNSGFLLDRYAGENVMEYFAQCGEATDGLYKPHSVMYNRIFGLFHLTSSLDNTRAKLLELDPEMFQFLKSLREIPFEISQVVPQRREHQGLAHQPFQLVTV